MRHFKLEQAARQALVFIESLTGLHIEVKEEQDEIITAMREALAEQAEQEPVGNRIVGNDADGYIVENLYAAHVRTKDLTDDEIAKAIAPFQHEFIATGRTTMNFARAVIAADRKKNKCQH